MKLKHLSAAAAALGLLCMFTAGVGCREKAALRPPDQTYTLRGVIDELPEQGDPQPEVKIHHENIPNFMNAQGKAVGMKSMTMPFPLAAGIDTQGIQVDDPVEFTFEVRWNSIPHLQLTGIKPLPAGTVVFPASGPREMPGATTGTLSQ